MMIRGGWVLDLKHGYEIYTAGLQQWLPVSQLWLAPRNGRLIGGTAMAH